MDESKLAMIRRLAGGSPQTPEDVEGGWVWDLIAEIERLKAQRDKLAEALRGLLGLAAANPNGTVYANAHAALAELDAENVRSGHDPQMEE